MIELTTRLKFYPKQAGFLNATEPIKAFSGGQGAGKSYVGAYDLIKRAEANRLYMVVAPTFTMLRDSSFRTFQELAVKLHRWLEIKHTEFLATIRTAGGGFSEVIFRSADDPDRLRGPNLSGIWMDEASLLAEQAFQISVARLREGGKRGWLSATFTPKGRSHWTYKVFGSDGPDVFFTRAATRENPFISPDFVKMVHGQYAGLRAQQELGGEFVSIEGAEWPAECFDPSIWFDEWPSDIQIRTIGIDPSKGKDARSGDYSAIVKLGRTGDGTLWCEADLRRDRNASQIVDQAIDYVRRFKPDGVAWEVNLFQELFLNLIDAASTSAGVIVPIYPIVNQVNKQVRIRRLTPFLMGGKMKFKANSPGTQILIDQLREFPEGEHDDGPDGLEMALRLMIQLWNGRVRRSDASQVITV